MERKYFGLFGKTFGAYLYRVSLFMVYIGAISLFLATSKVALPVV
jgi:hypothetical protein